MNDEMYKDVNPFPTGKIELVGIVLFLVGLVLRFAHLPFSGPVTVISLGSLAAVNVVRGFEIMLFKEDEKQNPAVSIVTGLLLAIGCIGILFRLMYWPFSQMHLTIACFGLPIVFGWLAVVRSKVIYKETAKFYSLKLLRVAIVFALAATLYSISLKTQIDIENWDDAEMARLKYNHFNDQKNVEHKEAYLKYRKAKYNR